MFSIGQMKCPSCGSILTPREPDGRLACDRCGHTMALRFDEESRGLVPCHTEPPPGTRVTLSRVAPDEIVIVIPGRPRWWWLASALFLAFMVAVAVIAPQRFHGPPWVFVFVGLALAAASLKGLFNSFGKTVVRIGPERFTIAKSLCGLGWSRSGQTRRIRAIRIVDRAEGKKGEDGKEMPPDEMIEIRTPWRYYGFGRSLRPPDRLWVFREIAVFLRDIGHPVD